MSETQTNADTKGIVERLPPKASPQPCGSCPYRKDVPSGIWEMAEYDKLPAYDGETWEQSPALFMCHQRDGNLCGGWLACHGTDHMLALRVNRVDPSVFSYRSSVPVFNSGAAARSHGICDLANPASKASRMISGLVRKRTALNLIKEEGNGR